MKVRVRSECITSPVLPVRGFWLTGWCLGGAVVGCCMGLPGYASGKPGGLMGCIEGKPGGPNERIDGEPGEPPERKMWKPLGYVGDAPP